MHIFFTVRSLSLYIVSDKKASKVLRKYISVCERFICCHFTQRQSLFDFPVGEKVSQGQNNSDILDVPVSV